MTREAAGTSPAGGSVPGSPMAIPDGEPEPAVTGARVPEVRPQSPQFTAAVDQVGGTIRVRGHLDRIGAEMLLDALVALQRCGHRHVTVQFRPHGTVDTEGQRLLTDLARRLGADGLRLEFQ
jgi:hypothetical protein